MRIYISVNGVAGTLATPATLVPSSKPHRV
jgi:hypothetical protein